MIKFKLISSFALSSTEESHARKSISDFDLKFDGQLKRNYDILALCGVVVSMIAG